MCMCYHMLPAAPFCSGHCFFKYIAADGRKTLTKGCCCSFIVSYLYDIKYSVSCRVKQHPHLLGLLPPLDAAVAQQCVIDGDLSELVLDHGEPAAVAGR